MKELKLISLLISISAVFAYCNHKFFKLPTAIGLMLSGLVLSVTVISIGFFEPSWTAHVKDLLDDISFSTFLLDFMLSFLLFAGALHVKLGELAESKKPIISYSTIGVIISTVTVGTLLYYIGPLVSIQLPYLHCLLFGALISPTDPIAVMGILKKSDIPKNLQTEIIGESLFNDGVGVVVFLTLFQIVSLGADKTNFGEISFLLVEEIGGGIVLGLLLGYLGYVLCKSIDHYQTEVLIVLAIVMGGYSLANTLHFSGPLAMVATGLLMGNFGNKKGMSDTTQDYHDKFWELIDEIFNAILFVLIGLELVLIDLSMTHVLAGLVVCVIVLVSRFISVSLPFVIFNGREDQKLKKLTLMTWGGLRGGISVALALSLAAQIGYKDIIVGITYFVVLFSITVQGLSMNAVIRRLKITSNE